MSYRVVSEMNDGICIAEVDVEDLIEQELNARIMEDAKFKQLVSNIKKRGELEQLPYCAKTDKGIEIVSGHHRVRAAKLAGLKQIHILLDKSGLSRSAIAAKQIAHNSIEGTDDQKILKQISDIITDVDDMLETALTEDFFNNVMSEVEKASVPKVDFEWKTIQFMFLPHMVEDLERLKKAVNAADLTGFVPIEEFENMVNAISKAGDVENVRNIGAVVHAMIKKTLEDYGDVGDDMKDYSTIASVFGRGIIPKKDAVVIQDMVKKAMNEGKIKNAWEIFSLISEENKKGE